MSGLNRELLYIQYSLSTPNPFGTDEFVQYRPVYDLHSHRFKLHRHLVYGTVKSVWLRHVFGLLRDKFRQVYSGIGLDRFTQGSV